MVNLLEVYENMKLAEAEVTPKVEVPEVPEVPAVAETEKVAEEQVVDERMEALYKYASLADHYLAEEYGEDYVEEDVIKLAQLMINHDIEQEDAMEKVAELEQAGIVMARAFKAELMKEESK